MEILGYIASLAMGIALGLFGGGGSVLTVPIMVYLFQVSPMTATAYSLFVVGLTAFIGSIMYIRKGEIDFKIGLLFAIPSVLGVHIARAWILPSIPDEVIRLDNFLISKDTLIMVTFAILMIAASLSMLKSKQPSPQAQQLKPNQMFVMSLEGLIVGLIAGFVGAGGGFLIIPALVFMAGLEMRNAIGTSLTIIAFQSLLGFAGDISRGLQINWFILSSVSIIAAMGIVVGFLVVHRLKEQKLKLAFGWFVLIMGAAIFIEQAQRILTH